LPFTNSAFRTVVVDQPPLFENTASEPYTSYVNVLSPAHPLKVTLVWSDYPATAGADKQLVNDLDLSVRTPRTLYRGNVLSGGGSVPGGGPDRTNNVEQVVWQTPATGIVELSVSPHVIPQPTQDFALVVSGDFVPVPRDRDHDGDELPDYWELWHFGSLARVADGDDDGDHASNYDEYVAGTAPDDVLDVLEMTAITPAVSNVMIQWTSEEGRYYRVRSASNQLLRGWTVVTGGVFATEPLNTLTVRCGRAQRTFYQVQVDTNR
jgi:hypothetical protein